MVHALNIGMRAPHFEILSHDPANLDLARHVIVYPDAVVRENGTPIAVVDAKYKLAAAEQDVYQVITYCHALGLSTAFLVHPESEQPLSGTLHILGTEAIKVQYLSPRLSGGIPELGEQAAALPRHILEELGREEYLEHVHA